MHLVHDFGVLAPHARLRKQEVPEAREDSDLDPCGHRVAYTDWTSNFGFLAESSG